MLCLASFCVVVFGVLAVIWSAKTTGPPQFPSFAEVLSWWKKSKVLAILYLSAKLLRGGMWTAAGALATGGVAVVACVCHLVDWKEIHEYVIKPTLDFLYWLGQRIWS